MFILRFFKWIFMSIWRVFTNAISLFLAFFVLVMFFSMVAAIKYDIERKNIPQKTALFIDFEKISSQQKISPLESFLEGKVNMTQLIDSVRKAASDERVKGIVANVSVMPLSMAQIEEIKPVFEEFANTGKFLKVYANFYTSDNFPAAVLFTDRWISEVGDIQLTGTHREYQFFKNMFDKIGVEAQIVRRHEYKGFPEMYMQTSFSEPSKESITAIHQALYDAKAKLFLEKANFDLKKSDGEPYLAQTAIAAGVIQKTGYLFEMADEIKQGFDVKSDDWVSVSRYQLSFDPVKANGKDKVIVLHLDGAIEAPDAKNEAGNILPIPTNELILKAANDEKVKAIVVQINSPGGSYMGSDMIWAALMHARAKGKTVTISMSSAAASGGYYIASAGQKIVAQPSTITGSIGVFGGKFVFEDLAGEIGVTKDTIEIGNQPINESPLTRYSAEDIRKHNLLIDAAYEKFTDRVKKARGMTDEQVDKVARGRVWIGTTAKEIGLVDELGGLEMAIDMALELAESDRQSVVVEHWPEASTGISGLFSGMNILYYKAIAIFEDFQGLMAIKDQLDRVSKSDAIQAYNPVVDQTN